VEKGVFPMFGSGKTLYHSLYIDNLVDAFVLAQDPERGNGRAYLIADEHYVEIEDLVQRVARAMGKEVRIPHYPFWPVVVVGHVVEKVCKPFGIAPPIFPRRVDWFRQDRAFDIGNAKRDLGYRPKVDLDEGLRRAYEWYKAEQLL
jgi:2-alkyl-3-oxoalkanoate reductase